MRAPERTCIERAAGTSCSLLWMDLLFHWSGLWRTVNVAARDPLYGPFHARLARLAASQGRRVNLYAVDVILRFMLPSGSESMSTRPCRTTWHNNHPLSPYTATYRPCASYIHPSILLPIMHCCQCQRGLSYRRHTALRLSSAPNAAQSWYHWREFCGHPFSV